MLIAAAVISLLGPDTSATTQIPQREANLMQSSFSFGTYVYISRGIKGHIIQQRSSSLALMMGKDTGLEEADKGLDAIERVEASGEPACFPV